MKIFAIRDASIAKDRDLAWLLYYPAADEFHIEICDGVDEWEAPLLISSFVKRGKKSMDSDSSRLWAELRIIPPDRQNLGMILRDNGLDSYDSFRLLVLAGGRCAQDDCFLVPLREDNMPKELEKRLQRTILSFLPSQNNIKTDSCDVLFFFRDGMIRRLSGAELFSETSLHQKQRERLSLYRNSFSEISLTAEDCETAAGVREELAEKLEELGILTEEDSLKTRKVLDAFL